MGQTENGRTGFVPSNMVSEIQLDDAEIEAHLFAGALNLENPNRVTCKKFIFFNLIFPINSF